MLISNSISKIGMAITAALIASLATFPYGFHFAGIIFSTSTKVYVLFGYFFALCAVLANICLGTYSLLNVQEEVNFENCSFPAILVSIIGAIPVGFVAFYGYQQTLTPFLNILISSIVTLVNSAINYTAIKNLLKTFNKITLVLANKKMANQLSKGEILVRALSALLGAIVSIFGYLAAVNGLVEVFIYFQFDKSFAYKLGSIIGIITWLPSAALYSNATQVVGGKFYNYLREINKKIKKLTWYDLLFLILICGSGSALAQMVEEFFSPDKNIPEIFKAAGVQSIVDTVLVPMAYLSSVAVNYFALRKIVNLFKR